MVGTFSVTNYNICVLFNQGNFAPCGALRGSETDESCEASPCRLLEPKFSSPTNVLVSKPELGAFLRERAPALLGSTPDLTSQTDDK